MLLSLHPTPAKHPYIVTQHTINQAVYLRQMYINHTYIDDTNKQQQKNRKQNTLENNNGGSDEKLSKCFANRMCDNTR